MQNLPPLQAGGLTGYVHHSAGYELCVVQQPTDGRALCSPRRNARGAVKWPLDPPCVVELIVRDDDTSRAYLHSPYWFCTSQIEAMNEDAVKTDTLTGALTSSLHKVKLHDSRDHGVFVFGDLYVKYPGVFRLKFTVFEMRQGPESMVAARLNDVYSKPFEIRSSKIPSPLRESTALSKALSEAGVKLRIRKEATKRKMTTHDWTANSMVQSVWGNGFMPSTMPQTAVMAPPIMQQGSHYLIPQVANNGENVSHRLSFHSLGQLGLRDHLNKEYGSSAQMALAYPTTTAFALPTSQPPSSAPVWTAPLAQPSSYQLPPQATAPDGNVFPTIQWTNVVYQEQHHSTVLPGLFPMNPDGTNATNATNAWQHGQTEQTEQLGEQSQQSHQAQQYPPIQLSQPSQKYTSVLTSQPGQQYVPVQASGQGQQYQQIPLCRQGRQYQPSQSSQSSQSSQPGQAAHPQRQQGQHSQYDQEGCYEQENQYDGRNL